MGRGCHMPLMFGFSLYWMFSLSLTVMMAFVGGVVLPRAWRPIPTSSGIRRLPISRQGSSPKRNLTRSKTW